MHTCIVAVLALPITPFVLAAPFLPQEGTLQHYRRRAVDYPVNPVAKEQRGLQRLQKREAQYSVVQVDGGSSNVPPVTVVETVTTNASPVSPSTETVVITSTVQGPVSDETILITKTREVAIPASTSVVTEDTLTVTSTQPASTVIGSSSTQYYDNGLWHTYYPVKSFSPPTTTTSASTVTYNNGLYTPTARASSSEPAWMPANSTANALQDTVSSTEGSNQKRSQRTVMAIRKAPGNLKVPRGELTRTEERGLKRFGR